MNHQYMVFASEGGKLHRYAECETLEEAEFAANEVIGDASIDSVAIYHLQKVGHRIATVAWDEYDRGVPRETPQEEPALPPRPAYQGANKRWGDDEITYMKEAKDMGMSFEGIAKKLGRTKHAVELKYSRECG